VSVVVDCNGRLFNRLLHPCGSGDSSKTWLTGETAMAVELVRSPRQTWSLETAIAGSETSVNFSSHFHNFTLLTAFDQFPSLRDDSLLFLMLCSSPPSLRSSTFSFPASRGMISCLLQALRAEEETALAPTLRLSPSSHTAHTTFPPLVDDPRGGLLNGGDCFALSSPSLEWPLWQSYEGSLCWSTAHP
jgi:hypothetical protein